MRAISITVDLMFRLKVLEQSMKVKIHIINTSSCTLYILKFFIGVDTLFLAPILKIFRRRLPDYTLITQLIKTRSELL